MGRRERTKRVRRRERRGRAVARKRYPGGGSDFFCAIFCEFVQEPRVAEAGEEQGGRRDGGEKKVVRVENVLRFCVQISL